MELFRSFKLVLALAVVVSATGAQAQQGEAQSTSNTLKQSTKSGYSQAPTLEGGDGVTAQIAEDDAFRGGLIDNRSLQQAIAPWFDFKRMLNDQLGLQLNFSFQTLYQQADATLTGIDEAAATRWQLQGAWTLLNRGTQNPGSLTFRIENRNTANQDIPPSQLGFQFGSQVNTGTGFSDWDGIVISEVAWRQTVANGRFKFILGKISAISWYNTHALSGSLSGFQNTSHQSSLSKPAPGRAFGFGFGYEISDKLVLLGGIHDANGRTTGDPFDSIEDSEFFYSTELRYYLSTPDRALFDTVKMQLWYQDARADAGFASSSGVTVQASYLFDEKYYPFFVAGASDGNASIYDRDVIAGLGIFVDTQNRPARDLFGIAAAWGRPSLDLLREEYSAELFYRYQVLDAFAVTPSIQVIFNPAANPMQDRVTVISLRTRLVF